jgi:hypothetical protein
MSIAASSVELLYIEQTLCTYICLVVATMELVIIIADECFVQYLLLVARDDLNTIDVYTLPI